MAYPSIDEVFRNPIMKLVACGIGAVVMAASGIAYHNFDDKMNSILFALNDPQQGVNRRIDELASQLAQRNVRGDERYAGLIKSDSEMAQRVDGIEHRVWTIEQLVGRN